MERDPKTTVPDYDNSMVHGGWTAGSQLDSFEREDLVVLYRLVGYAMDGFDHELEDYYCMNCYADEQLTVVHRNSCADHEACEHHHDRWEALERICTRILIRIAELDPKNPCRGLGHLVMEKASS